MVVSKSLQMRDASETVDVSCIVHALHCADWRVGNHSGRKNSAKNKLRHSTTACSERQSSPLIRTAGKQLLVCGILNILRTVVLKFISGEQHGHQKSM